MRRADGLLAALILLFALAACAPREAPKPPPLAFRAAAFADLPGWPDAGLADAAAALKRSCPRLVGQADRTGIDNFPRYGLSGDWQPLCRALQMLGPNDAAGFRALVEAELQPVQVLGEGKAEGLFTGYYEPTLRGSRQRRDGYAVPLYRAPPDLVQVDLGLFRPEWRGMRTAGRVVQGQLRPYEDRAAIEAGALANRNLELAWAADAVDAFFLQIQGSGRVALSEGGVMRVGFAAQNGHAYTALGRVLIDRGLMAREEVTMPSLRAFLERNPQLAPDLLRQNAAYVFFRELPAPKDATDGPLGAQGVPLYPGRSLAVDRTHFALGLPVWLDTAYAEAAPPHAERPLRRLMIAQDTGGAIRGGVRGDVFWGDGAEAEGIAGRMKHPGRWWLLLPKAVAARIVQPGA